MNAVGFRYSGKNELAKVQEVVNPLGEILTQPLQTTLKEVEDFVAITISDGFKDLTMVQRAAYVKSLIHSVTVATELRVRSE